MQGGKPWLLLNYAFWNQELLILYSFVNQQDTKMLILGVYSAEWRLLATMRFSGGPLL
jgi:hypothetical protein